MGSIIGSGGGGGSTLCYNSSTSVAPKSYYTKAGSGAGDYAGAEITAGTEGVKAALNYKLLCCYKGGKSPGDGNVVGAFWLDSNVDGPKCNLPNIVRNYSNSVRSSGVRVRRVDGYIGVL